MQDARIVACKWLDYDRGIQDAQGNSITGKLFACQVHLLLVI